MRLVLKSGWFDPAHYSRQAGMGFSSPEAAAAHFLAAGWTAGLDPSPSFSTRHYLRSHGDVRRAKVNPLLHYLTVGAGENRRPRPVPEELAEAPRAPPPARWLELRARRPASVLADDEDSVDVVIPAYKGVNDTLACIEAVLASQNATPFHLVVIDDASPEPALSQALQELAELDLIHLVRNPENLGFVQTANRGLQLSRRRDVLLLNADTVVYGDWLDRMRAHAGSAQRVATVTPFSNNAGPFSYPFTRSENSHQLELSYAELDALFATANVGQAAEVPTGVGFCFYVTRDCIREVGAFDPGFGRGYGEENDLCFRAGKAGWRNLAALDVFVRHTGGVSFETATAEAKTAASSRLAQLHPSYAETVDAFIDADPLGPARTRVDLARVRRLTRGRGVLMIEHGWGGGIERHVTDLAGRLAQEGVQSLRALPTSDGSGLRLSVIGGRDFPNLPHLPPDFSAADTLGRLGLAKVHIHSLLGQPHTAVDGLLRSIRDAGLEYDFTCHDYAAICPRLNMVDWGGMYCDNRDEDHCRVCIAHGEVRVGPVEISTWRTAYGQVLRNARRVFAPDPDVAARILRYHPELGALHIRPHPPVGRTSSHVSEGQRPGPARLVGVVGAIGPGKGSGLLIRLAGDALERGLPLRYRIFGYTNRPELNRFPNVDVTGRYAEEAIDELLNVSRPDLMLYPAVAPETFCYALDIAFRNRLFPVCFDLGAPARRIRQAGFGSVLPFSLIEHPGKVNDALLALDVDASHWSESVVFPEERRWTSVAAYYDGPAEPAVNVS